MSTPPRIDTLDLLEEVNGHLLTLLRSLHPGDWHRPTMCSAWDVKDIAAHLLDTALRRLRGTSTAPAHQLSTSGNS